MGGLLCFRMKTILASFHDVGILCVIEKLMSVRALMVCVLRCMFEMLPGSVEDVFFLLPRTSRTTCAVNDGVMFVF